MLFLLRNQNKGNFGLAYSFCTFALMLHKLKAFYAKYKQYMVVDVLMYGVMILLIILLFVFFG